jgi:GMP synthase (glutamine-hydrolysing)
VRIEPVGWLPEAADDPLFAPVRSADRALHWNRDVVVSLPAGATVLARSKDGAVQVARLGRHVWGIQSHPEVDAPIVEDWLEEEWDVTEEPERRLLTDLVDDVRAQEHSLRSGWMPLTESFARMVSGGSTAS